MPSPLRLRIRTWIRILESSLCVFILRVYGVLQFVFIFPRDKFIDRDLTVIGKSHLLILRGIRI